MIANCAILVLAAGGSSRMGRAKQSLVYKGNSLLGTVLQMALNCNLSQVFCVYGAYQENVLPILKTFDQVKPIENPLWEAGIGSSISIGVSSILKANPKCDYILIALADQPLITSAHLINLTQKAHLNKCIAATNYGNNVGVPAVFPSKYFSSLMNIDPNQGAKTIIESNPHTLIKLANEKLVDIDTPKDFEKLKSI